MRLNWHDYGYYPYERALAVREVATLFGAPTLREVPGGVELTGGNTKKRSAAWRSLTYFAGTMSGRRVTETLQSRLEGAVRSGKTRQATRYSVHRASRVQGEVQPTGGKGAFEHLRRSARWACSGSLLRQRHHPGGMRSRWRVRTRL